MAARPIEESSQRLSPTLQSREVRLFIARIWRVRLHHPTFVPLIIAPLSLNHVLIDTSEIL